MTDDELLASAFRKILAADDCYIDIEDTGVTIDGWCSIRGEGLTEEELAAMRRAGA